MATISYIIPETDRAAEIVTLTTERNYLLKRHNESEKEEKPFISRLIAQIDRDIARNQEQIKAILR